MRWIRRLLVALLVLVVVAAVAGTWLVRRSFPITDGEVTIDTLEGPATVSRNQAGIPHIRATTSHDLFLAQGYVHAQDRFWQMDTWRHIGAGRLSEMFGESQVETDAFLRTLGFERLAEETYASAPDHVREALDAYAAGVNAYLDERPSGAALSLEYAVLGLQNSGYSPARWDPVDSLTWAHVMAWDLRANLEDEIDRAVVAGVVGIDRTEQLYPPYPDTHPVIVSDSSRARGPETPTVLSGGPGTDRALARVSASIAGVDAVLGSPFEGIGSNNWVVDGSHTESGAPLLANDPHLGIQMPSIWHQTVLWCEEVRDECPYRVSGFSFPGAPGVVIGHNERIAWGVTNLAPDTMDLFIERTDGDRYEVDGEMVDFDVHTETISVAGGDDVELEIRSTRHGPVVSGRLGDLDDLDSGGIDLPDEYQVSLAWKALEPSTLFQSLLGINAAADWDEFRAAASFFDVAAQNLIYADIDGHIGYQATGDIPIRRSGDGRYPAPGWTSEHEWEGSIPFEDLPSMLDPPSGVIATANQPVVDEGYDRLIGIDHAYGYRALRINQLLADSAPLSIDDMAAIQMDAREGSAEAVVPRVLALTPTDPAVEAIQDVLDRWGDTSEPFQMSPSSPGAAAYAATWRHLLALTFDELPEDRGASGGSRYFEVVRHLLEDPSDPWWDVTATPERETADDVLEQAVVAAHEELTTTLGDDPLEWRWDDLHAAHFENQTLGQSGISPIEMLFNRAVTSDVGGSASVVNATSWSAPDGYEVIALPSLRMVVDLGDFSRSVGIHTTGQSGHAFHSHYFDMAEDWARGRHRPLPFDPGDFVARSTLSLSQGSTPDG